MFGSYGGNTKKEQEKKITGHQDQGDTEGKLSATVHSYVKYRVKMVMGTKEEPNYPSLENWLNTLKNRNMNYMLYNSIG